MTCDRKVAGNPVYPKKSIILKVAVMKYDNLSTFSNAENRYKSRLSIALTLIMILSVMAPSLSPSIDNLEIDNESEGHGASRPRPVAGALSLNFNKRVGWAGQG